MIRRFFDRFSRWTQEADVEYIYFFKMLMLAALPAYATSLIFSIFISEVPPPVNFCSNLGMFDTIIDAPIFETAVMIPVIFVLRKVTPDVVLASAISGMLWGLIHVLGKPPLAILTAWPFFVFSLMLQTWQARSKWKGYWGVVLCHSLYNVPIVVSVCVYRLP